MSTFLSSYYLVFVFQAAIDVPRFCIGAHSYGDEISLEDGIDERVVEELRQMGHNVKLKSGHDRAVFGRAQIIQRLPSGVLWAGSDGRADGMAIGW